MTHSTSEFGEEYDSLADLVSFGVAPAVLAYSWGLADFHRLGWMVSFLFVVCGSMRLARFNIQTHVVDKRYFVGLPDSRRRPARSRRSCSPRRSGSSRGSGWGACSALTFVLSYLMISTIRYRSFKDLDLKRRRPVWIAARRSRSSSRSSPCGRSSRSSRSRSSSSSPGRSASSSGSSGARSRRRPTRQRFGFGRAAFFAAGRGRRRRRRLDPVAGDLGPGRRHRVNAVPAAEPSASAPRTTMRAGETALEGRDQRLEEPDARRAAGRDRTAAAVVDLVAVEPARPGRRPGCAGARSTSTQLSTRDATEAWCVRLRARP